MNHCMKGERITGGGLFSWIGDLFTTKKHYRGPFEGDMSQAGPQWNDYPNESG
jgi:hypothetical protein